MARRAKAIKPKIAKIRGKKPRNTVSQEHLEVTSLLVKSMDGESELAINGGGLWITDAQNPLIGVAIYKVKGQMAIGLRQGTDLLGAALSVDKDGSGYLQLMRSNGEALTVTADDLAKLLGK